MKVTFDSNLWEQVVRPDIFKKDPNRHSFLCVLHEAIKQATIQAFVSDVVATLEAIKRTDRADYLAKQHVVPITKNVVLGNGEVRKIVFAGPDQSHRPPLKPILTDRISEGYNLGIRFMKAPRYNEYAFPIEYYANEPMSFLQQWGKIEHEIAKRGVGRSLLREMAFKLGRKIEGAQAYFDIPDVPMTEQEKMEVSNAVAEWADGDAVASHVAHENDFFCTEDIGGKRGARRSVLNTANRNWLKDMYGVNFVNLEDMATKVEQLRHKPA